MRETGTQAGGVSEFYSGALNKMNKIKSKLALLVVVAAAPMAAFADTPTDYGATLNTNLTTINSIWGTVATIMIAVALVTVGVRFFRKAK